MATSTSKQQEIMSYRGTVESDSWFNGKKPSNQNSHLIRILSIPIDGKLDEFSGAGPDWTAERVYRRCC